MIVAITISKAKRQVKQQETNICLLLRSGPLASRFKEHLEINKKKNHLQIKNGT